MSNLKQEAICTAKQRILEVAATTFSEVGFAAARVAQIATAAGVTKALIYYYFPSKEAILDELLEEFFASVERDSLDVVENTIVRYINAKKLDIAADGFEFASEGELAQFLAEVKDYYQIIIKNLLHRREIIRILMLESLTNGKYKNAIFRLYSLTEQKAENPLYTKILSADRDFAYSNRAVFDKLFFGMFPLLSYAAYSKDYEEVSGVCEDELTNYCIEYIFSQVERIKQGKKLVWQ